MSLHLVFLELTLHTQRTLSLHTFHLLCVLLFYSQCLILNDLLRLFSCTYIYIYNTGFFKASTSISLIRSAKDPIKLLIFQYSLPFNLLLSTFSSIASLLFHLLFGIIYCGIVSYCSTSAIQRSTSELF